MKPKKRQIINQSLQSPQSFAKVIDIWLALRYSICFSFEIHMQIYVECGVKTIPKNLPNQMFSMNDEPLTI